MLSNSPRGRFAKVRQIVARPRWVLDVALRGRPHSIANLSGFVPDPTDLAAYKAWIDAQFDPGVTWRDIEWLRGLWRGRLLLKGIQEVDDARSAVAAGADGVIVSNHGGRQLDSVASAVAKLPAVVDAIGDRAEILLDGGVRNGLDVLKAVALGARGAMIGRPWVYAIAAGGTPALADLLGTFRRELEVGMSLAGVTRVADLGRGHLDLPA
jgi:L-lactate dehydrogenase (cytochrome)